VPAALLSLLSLWNDRSILSPSIRLSFQFVAALVLVIGSSIQDQLSTFLIIFYVLYIVATANWYNFMDGINGIASLTAVIGFGFLAGFNFFTQGNSQFSVLSICIAVSCLGFLPFNMPKAKVFIGDVGSVFLGFVFAAMVVILSKSFLDFTCLAGFLFPFYADEFTTMAVRIRDGENLILPHRRHLYQLLANEMRISHWKITMAYGILQIVVAGSVLLARPFGVWAVSILLVIYFAGFVWVNNLVRVKILRQGEDGSNIKWKY
jgi:Fuc2NAc and GlcNAc transferase